MKLFLDGSVLIAGICSGQGASRELFRLASQERWELVTIPYVLNEVDQNLPGLRMADGVYWKGLREVLQVWPDVPSTESLCIPRPRTDRFCSARSLGRTYC